jgi:phosphoribosylamine--glycine ligase
VVVEEFLQGEEASFIIMADGAHALPFASSQDHKRLKDGDLGPNTGGMGAYSPAPVVTPAVHERVMREVIAPTLEGLKKDGTPYTGFLYAGLMIDATGAPRVIEYNCRFGDPEAQAVLARLRSSLPGLCLAAIEGRLTSQSIDWDPRAALGVVMAAEGYPGTPKLGSPISGLDSAAQLPGKVYHAGTEQRGPDVITSGGRVLCAVGLGSRVAQAQRAAYDLIACLSFPGAQFRNDIGYRAIARES